MNVFYAFVVLGIFASACSQLLLKTSAARNHESRLAEILNWRVILGYVIFFCSMLINTIALGHGVRVKDMPVLESLGYIFVPVLSYMILHERLSSRLILGMGIIGMGIIVFYA